jgi:peroxiredoxin Q/BCP
MRLSAGQKALAFDTTDIFGKKIALNETLHQKILLSFFRYASCPLCNLRVNHLIRNFEKMSASGLTVIAIFQSPIESIRTYVGKQDAPFQIIADPHQLLYKKYGVTGSMLGMLKSSLRIKDISQSFSLGFLPGKIEGSFTMVPADFLIDKNFVINTAFYGKDLGDHLPFDNIDSWLDTQAKHEPAAS